MPDDSTTPPAGSRILGPVATGLAEYAERLGGLARNLRSGAGLIDTVADHDREALLRQIEQIVKELGDESHEVRRLIRRGTGRD